MDYNQRVIMLRESSLPLKLAVKEIGALNNRQIADLKNTHRFRMMRKH